MRRTATTAALAGALAALLAGCAEPPDPVVGCMFEVDPPGAYEWPAGPGLAVVTPGEGGTAEGAAALNACVRARASAAVPPPARPGSNERVAARATGATVTETYTYGNPPAEPSAARRLRGREADPAACSLEMVGAGFACER